MAARLVGAACRLGDWVLSRPSWRAYEAQLAARPLQTKMLTSCSLMAAGDVIAQRLGDEPYRPEQTAAMSAWGLMVHAPWFHKWYGLLDRRLSGTSARMIVPKVALDLGLNGPMYVSSVLVYICLVKTGDPSACGPFWWDVFPKAYSSAVATHAVFQTINFRFVPNRQRILYDNCTSLLWKTLLLLLSNNSAVRAVEPSTAAS